MTTAHHHVTLSAVPPRDCETCNGTGAHVYNAFGDCLECPDCGMGVPLGKRMQQCAICSGRVDAGCKDCLEIDKWVVCEECVGDPGNHCCDVNPEMREFVA